MTKTSAKPGLSVEDIPEQVWRIILDLKAIHSGTTVSAPTYYYAGGCQWDVHSNYPVLTVVRTVNPNAADRARAQVSKLELDVALTSRKLNSLTERGRTLNLQTDRNTEAAVSANENELADALVELESLERQIQELKPQITPETSRLTIPFDQPLKVSLVDSSAD